MASTKKWNEERTEQLVGLVGESAPVTQATVKSVAAEMDTTERSISSKLRKMGYEVEPVAAKTSKFSEAQAATLAKFVTENSGKYTYAELAEALDDGVFTSKQIQGKVLSMELTEHIKPSPKVEVERKYSATEEDTFIQMVTAGAFIEDIAEALGKPLASIRGKALSFLRSGEIEAIPKQKNSTAKDPVDAFENLGDVSGMTVDQIAEALGKTSRGVRTILTRRGVTAADYDGAAKQAKRNAE